MVSRLRAQGGPEWRGGSSDLERLQLWVRSASVGWSGISSSMVRHNSSPFLIQFF